IPFETPSDVIIQIELENEIHDIHVLVRPYVKEFLESMSKSLPTTSPTASLLPIHRSTISEEPTPATSLISIS
ncbi:MAG: hypothetical protein IIZ90_05195, partial [Bacteroidales bacterium]|nr:hypothetical protein [Bacteroidales bacterium]